MVAMQQLIGGRCGFGAGNCEHGSLALRICPRSEAACRRLFPASSEIPDLDLQHGALVMPRVQPSAQKAEGRCASRPAVRTIIV